MRKAWLIVLLLLGIAGAYLGFSAHGSAGFSSGEPVIRLRIDVRNLLSQSAKETLPRERVESLIESVNAIYTTCRVQFVPRQIVNLRADSLDIPFPPRSEMDLQTIAAKIHPHGFNMSNEALPLTFAGEFSFYAPNYGVTLYGLTWSFLEGPGKILRMHSFIARQHLDHGSTLEIVAHELGHFFLLPHTTQAGNIMAAGRQITKDQCAKIRSFALNYYQPIIN